MVKVTLYENLVPSQHPGAKGYLYSDLVYNVFLARNLIRAAQFFFQLRQGSAIYSGYVMEHPVAPFALRLRHKGQVVRTLLLNELGYCGELCADVEDLEAAVHQDVLAGLALRPVAQMAVC